MISLVKMKKFDVIAVYKVDRIARNVFDFVDIFRELEAHNTALVSITEGFDPTTPMGKMTMMMLASFADIERMNISQRVTDSMINIAKGGCFTGGVVPRGCIVKKENGRSYIDIKEPDFIRLLFNTYIEEGSLFLSYKKLKSFNIELSREGYRKILRNPIYVSSSKEINDYLSLNGFTVLGDPNNKNAYITYGKTGDSKIAVITKHNGVLPPQLWLDVQLRLDKRNKQFKNTSEINWLTSILKCPFCGGFYHLASANKVKYYACQNTMRRSTIGIDRSKEKCINNKYIRADLLEDKIASYIKTLKDKTIFNQVYSYKSNDNIDFLTSLEKSYSSNEKNINNLVDKLMLVTNAAAKPITDKIEELTKKNQELHYKIELEKLKKIEKESNAVAKDFIYNTILKFDEITDVTLKRDMISIIFSEIEYDPFADNLCVLV